LIRRLIDVKLFDLSRCCVCRALLSCCYYAVSLSGVCMCLCVTAVPASARLWEANSSHEPDGSVVHVPSVCLSTTCSLSISLTLSTRCS